MREIEILDHERNNNSSQNEASGNPNGNDETSGHFQQQSSLTFQINVIDSQTTSTSTHSPPSVFHSHGKSSNEGYIFACDNSTEKQDWMVAMLSIHSRGCVLFCFYCIHVSSNVIMLNRSLLGDQDNRIY